MIRSLCIVVVLGCASCLGGPDSDVESRDEAILQDWEDPGGFQIANPPTGQSHTFDGIESTPEDWQYERDCTPECHCPEAAWGCWQLSCGCDWNADGSECGGACLYQCPWWT